MAGPVGGDPYPGRVTLTTSDTRCEPAREDPFIRTLLAAGEQRIWRGDGATVAAQYVGDRRVRRMAGVGAVAAVARLAGEALHELADAGTTVDWVSVRRGAADRLAGGFALVDGDEWDWRCVDRPSEPVPGEDLVGWLPETAGGEIDALLDAGNERSSARPGNGHVRRWAGIRDGRGRLVCCLADTSRSDAYGHLSAITTHPGARGRGYGAAITAWATRTMFGDGADLVTLGMYADNEVARRLYTRLGFTDDHPFTSGHPTEGPVLRRS